MTDGEITSMSVLPKPITKQRFRRDLIYWLCIWVVPIGMTIVTYASIGVNYPADPDSIRVFNTLILLVWMCCGVSAALMIPVVFLEWFPEEYYEDLTECPVCGEKEVKHIDDCKCFACGANKEDIDSARDDELAIEEAEVD